jgi:hypothetical protein
MNLENVYGKELDYIPLPPDGAGWDDAIPELEWDEAEAQNIASELSGRRHEEY